MKKLKISDKTVISGGLGLGVVGIGIEHCVVRKDELSFKGTTVFSGNRLLFLSARAYPCISWQICVRIAFDSKSCILDIKLGVKLAFRML